MSARPTKLRPLDDGPRKIPATCPHCREPLSRRDMEDYLDRCELAGQDPVRTALTSKPLGAPCRWCFLRLVAEGVADGDSAARALLEAVARGDRPQWATVH